MICFQLLTPLHVRLQDLCVALAAVQQPLQRSLEHVGVAPAAVAEMLRPLATLAADLAVPSEATPAQPGETGADADAWRHRAKQRLRDSIRVVWPQQPKAAHRPLPAVLLEVWKGRNAGTKACVHPQIEGAEGSSAADSVAGEPRSTAQLGAAFEAVLDVVLRRSLQQLDATMSQVSVVQRVRLVPAEARRRGRPSPRPSF